MDIKNRNIILFFAENENTKNISSKIVRLYMNRFIIDEENQFEITGVFNLTKEPILPKVIPQRDPRRRRWNILMRNCLEDQKIIKKAFEKLKICTWFKTHILVFMGTQFYSEDLKFHKLLNKFLQDFANKCPSTTSISLTLLNGHNIGFRTKEKVEQTYSVGYAPWEDFWVRHYLDNDGYSLRYSFACPPNNVKWLTEDQWSTSLNQDLENFFEDMISTSAPMRYLIRGPGNLRMVRSYDSYDSRVIPIILDREKIATKLFLYEMQSEDDIKTRTDDLKSLSDDHQFMLSLCKRLSYYLKF